VRLPPLRQAEPGTPSRALSPADPERLPERCGWETLWKMQEKLCGPLLMTFLVEHGPQEST